MASVADLGFSNGASYKDICAKAIEIGLELCAAEVGPVLRLTYDDQPRGEWLRVAMEAIIDQGDSLIFQIGHDGNKLWLDADCGEPGRIWFCDDRFVFACPRNC